MNERVKSLVEQARKYARDYVADCKQHGYYMEPNELDARFEEKFAEMLVLECVSYVLADVADDDEYEDKKQGALDYFGFES